MLRGRAPLETSNETKHTIHYASHQDRSVRKNEKKQRLKPYNGGSSLHCVGIVLLLIVCKGCSAISNEMAAQLSVGL
jgi:hypothetical protein